jgi:glycosyltransferase involved in cell wall biosynthesis
MYLSLEEELKRYVSEHGLSDRVTFTGYQTNVADYLRASDLFVMPSEMEALCISLIEALACGLPSVACHVGGIPDVARHECEALLVKPADADVLADAIERLLDDSAFAESLAEQGKERMAEVFDIRTVAAQHRALFQHVRFGGVEGGAVRVD